jgi:hypothetical protein
MTPNILLERLLRHIGHIDIVWNGNPDCDKMLLRNDNIIIHEQYTANGAKRFKLNSNNSGKFFESFCEGRNILQLAERIWHESAFVGHVGFAAILGRVTITLRIHPAIHCRTKMKTANKCFVVHQYPVPYLQNLSRDDDCPVYIGLTHAMGSVNLEHTKNKIVPERRLMLTGLQRR